MIVDYLAVTPSQAIHRIMPGLLLAVVLGGATFYGGNVSAAEKTASPVGIAVLDFGVPATANHTWAWAEGGIADLLQMKLEQRGLVILDRDLTHAVLSEQRLAAGGLTARDSLKIASLLNARYLVAGKVAILNGGRFRVEADMFSVEAVETVVTGVGEGVYPAELSPVLETVAKKIAEALKATGTATAVKPRASGFMPKPEALIMFYRGLNACAQGRADVAVGWFMNAHQLDLEFGTPLLWEIKAYAMLGMAEHAAARRLDVAPILTRLGGNLETPQDGGGTKPVLAVLDPVITGQDSNVRAALPASPATVLKQAIMATGKFRVFAFENIGDAVAEQDLRLSTFFASRNAPRYGRWLRSDGLVLCRISQPEPGQIAVELTIMDPLTAATVVRIQRTEETRKLAALIPKMVQELAASWEPKKTMGVVVAPPPGQSPDAVDDNLREMPPVYRTLVKALEQVRREPDRNASHEALVSACNSLSLWRLAFLEVQRILGDPNIHAPDGEAAYWRLLDAANRVGPKEAAPFKKILREHAVGDPHADFAYWRLLNAADPADPDEAKTLINILVQQYPNSVVTAAYYYGLAHNDWWDHVYSFGAKSEFEHCRENALRSRNILEHLPYQGDAYQGQRAIILAAYYLEGWSLFKMNKLSQAMEVLTSGKHFSAEHKLAPAVYVLPRSPLGLSRLGDKVVINNPGSGAGMYVSAEIDNLLAQLDVLIDQDWLRRAREAVDLLEKTPGADASSFKETLATAKNRLRKCAGDPKIGTDASRPLAQRLLRILLTRQGISALDNADMIPSPHLLELAREILSIYDSAGIKREGWACLHPLFNDRYPAEIAAQLIMEATGDPEQFRYAQQLAAGLQGRETAVPGTVWSALAQICYSKRCYPEALVFYQHAMAKKVPAAQCPGLGPTLVEVALDENLDDTPAAISRLRREYGLPPDVPSWTDWFMAGRWHQVTFDFEKAIVCYRNVLESWSDQNDITWYSATFYLAQCLMQTKQEEAAALLRHIALKAGSDSIGLLLEVHPHGSTTTGKQLGTMAAEMLQRLHQKQNDAPGPPGAEPYVNPYKVLPVLSSHPQPPRESPPLPTVAPEIMQALEKILLELAQTPSPGERGQKAMAFMDKYGHDGVSAILSMLSSGSGVNEYRLVWMLERKPTVTKTDAPYLVAACKIHYGLMAVAAKVDPEGTTEAAKEAWVTPRPGSILQTGFIHPDLIYNVLKARLRPLYPLVLAFVSAKGLNHHSAIFELASAVEEEKSADLDAAFRDALADCIRLKWLEKDTYELVRISQIALRYGVPESLGALIDCLPPDQWLKDVRPYVDLPADDNRALEVLRANRNRWKWDSDQKHFRPEKEEFP